MSSDSLWAVDAVEALLFVADSPASAQSLAVVLNLTEGQVEQAIELLAKRLKKKGAIQLVQLAGGYQLSTKPEFAEAVGAFLKPQRGRLSKSLMEVLAIVAYKQPITMAEIEDIRGVSCDYGVKALVERRLILEVGRKQVPGRPLLYGTSAQFLHQFNLNNISELPPLEISPLALPEGEE